MGDPNVTLRLSAIEKILDQMMRSSEEQRIAGYATIKVLVEEIEDVIDEQAADHGYTHEKIGELLWHSAAIAKVDHDNGHPDTQHLLWARTALHSLRSAQCFGSPGG